MGAGSPAREGVIIVLAQLRAGATAGFLLLLLTACSSRDDAPAATVEGPPTAEIGATLLATVGTEDDPEAFEIALTTADGQDVTTLAAGKYTIDVTDYSTIHNFALSGQGVDEATSVSEVEQTTWTVTVEPGEYSYVCDPHPSMSGGFAVTA